MPKLNPLCNCGRRDCHFCKVKPKLVYSTTTPEPEKPNTPEQKLLNAIFGRKHES